MSWTVGGEPDEGASPQPAILMTACSFVKLQDIAQTVLDNW
jgi:hypothetical protein